ncbi:MAG: hypothetical protein H8D38_04745 [DPANN group archaeon]|nr:hypothetical protein [DPANN group archaeon]
MKITKERLATKGWADEEIDKTITILEKAKEKRHPRILLLDKTVYWIALLLVIFGNFAFSTFLIPILITFNNVSLYFIILLLAASFGIIMSVVIKDIEDLERKHHLAMLLIVPIIGLINFFIVVNITNNNPIADVLQYYHNPFLIGIVYLIGFMLPYSYLVFEEKWRR